MGRLFSSRVQMRLHIYPTSHRKAQKHFSSSAVETEERGVFFFFFSLEPRTCEIEPGSLLGAAAEKPVAISELPQ